jgi:hypothetical protein
MGKNEIVIICAVLAVVAFRLYKKYANKSKGITGSDPKKPSGSSFPSSVKDDDYEPYSKK